MARVLEASRVAVAWIPVGISMVGLRKYLLVMLFLKAFPHIFLQGAVEKTIEYVNTREAFGALLSSNQLIQGKFDTLVYN